MKTKKKWLSFLWAVLLLAVAIALPQLFPKKYHTNLMNQCLINIIVVTGLNFITGLTGQMNMGTAGIFSLGAYTSALLSTKLNVSPWLGLLAAIVMGCLIGVCLGYPSLRLKGVYLSLTTIGFSEVVRIFITNLDDLTGGAVGVTRIPAFSLFGFTFKDNVSNYYLSLAITVVLLLLAWRLVHSKWGRAFKAIKDNPEAMESAGVNIASLKIMAFTLAAIYGCIGGALYAHFIRYINPAGFFHQLCDHAGHRRPGHRARQRAGRHSGYHHAGNSALFAKLLLVYLQHHYAGVCGIPAQRHVQRAAFCKELADKPVPERRRWQWQPFLSWKT